MGGPAPGTAPLGADRVTGSGVDVVGLAGDGGIPWVQAGADQDLSSTRRTIGTKVVTGSFG